MSRLDLDADEELGAKRQAAGLTDSVSSRGTSGSRSRSTQR
jgi:hypothetical protein